MPGSVDAFVMDRELAVLLNRREEEPDLDEVVDRLPVFDESQLDDPFSRVPEGMG